MERAGRQGCGACEGADSVFVRHSVARYVQPASALLLLAAGAYLIYYWLTLGGLLARAGLG